MTLSMRLGYAATRMMSRTRRIGIMRWLKGRSQRKSLARAEIVLVSFPKSGRTWFRVMLSRCYAGKFGLDANTLIKRDNFSKIDRRIPVFLSFHGTFIREVAGKRNPAALFAGKKIVLLVRNPIDVSVSLYFHLLGARTKSVSREMKGVPDSMEGVSADQFVLSSPFNVAEIVGFMNDWTSLLAGNPHVLTIKYEDLREQPETEMRRVSAFLGDSFTNAVIESAVRSSEFEQLKEQERSGQFANAALRPREPGNPNSFKVRRGKVGGYVDYLSEASVRQAEAIVAEHLTKELGY